MNTVETEDKLVEVTKSTYRKYRRLGLRTPYLILVEVLVLVTSLTQEVEKVQRGMMTTTALIEKMGMVIQGTRYMITLEDL